MSEPVLQGGCFCLSIQYRISGMLYDLCVCHCETCRKTAGAAFVAWGTCKLKEFSVTRGKLTEHASSKHVIRGFCDHCGTSLTYRHDTRADEIDITLVTLEDPLRFTPECHLWVEDKLSWVNISDGLPQYKKARDDS